MAQQDLRQNQSRLFSLSGLRYFYLALSVFILPLWGFNAAATGIEVKTSQLLRAQNFTVYLAFAETISVVYLYQLLAVVSFSVTSLMIMRGVLYGEKKFRKIRIENLSMLSMIIALAMLATSCQVKFACEYSTRKQIYEQARISHATQVVLLIQLIYSFMAFLTILAFSVLLIVYSKKVEEETEENEFQENKPLYEPLKNQA